MNENDDVSRNRDFTEGALHEHIESFRQANPHAKVWTHDIVHGNEDEEPPDLPACEGMSRAFRDHLSARGVQAHVVQADQAEHDWADYHQFTRIPHPEGDINVDWTVRQYRNLDEPRNPKHYDQSEKVPAVWRGHASGHPISDLQFKRERVVRPEDPEVLD